MIRIEDKSKCCGCSACAQICPQSCISLTPDEEGFLYPVVNEKGCVNCGLCDKVCPFNVQLEARVPLHAYAAINENLSERLKSSSGGVFVLLAKKVIDRGGVVFGARFNNRWEVIHDYTETYEGISAFMGSKYVQSRIGNTYSQVKCFLKTGRKILFSGTPCQIAGLRNYLRKEYDNLLTVDVICHGVPSPAVWIQYLEEIKRSARKGDNSVSLSPISQVPERDTLSNVDDVTIESISFRDKRLGWKKYSFALTLAEAMPDGKQNTVSLSHIHRDDPYFVGFNDWSLFLRPICYSCQFRELRSGSDLTLADFWGIETLKPEMDDNKGVSVILSNTPKGNEMVQTLTLKKKEVDYQDVVKRNKAVIRSFNQAPRSIFDIIRYKKIFKTKRDYFFYDYKHTVAEKVRIICRRRLRDRFVNLLKRVLTRLCKLFK